MGYLQGFILDYMRGRRDPQTTGAILAAVARTYHITRNHLHVELGRMTRAGLLTRLERGYYALAQSGYAATCDHLLVAGTLDRLEAEYSAALRAELEARGWRKP